MSDEYPDWLDDDAQPDPDDLRERWLDARYDETGSFAFNHVKVFALTTLFTIVLVLYGIAPRGGH